MIDPLTEELGATVIKPKKTDITVQALALIWMPFWKDEQGILTSAI
jgi:hypothetical protein